MDKPGILSSITNIFSSHNVSIKSLIQNPNKIKNSSSIIIITHKSKDYLLNKTVKKIEKKPYILERPKLIRINES